MWRTENAEMRERREQGEWREHRTTEQRDETYYKYCNCVMRFINVKRVAKLHSLV